MERREGADADGGCMIKAVQRNTPPPSLLLVLSFFSFSLSLSLCPSCVRLARSIFHESRDLTHTVFLRMEIQLRRRRW